jgi:tetratricopeptide (TPR) repeat protein
MDSELNANEVAIEAEQYCLKATFILNELHANIKVYGSNSALTGAVPADIDLALQYINRALEHFPENHVYLNLKALLLWEGKKDKESAKILLQKASSIAPRDIDIQNNLKAIDSSQCFIATAAYGTPLASEIFVLRELRDNYLRKNFIGAFFVKLYEKISPPIANIISKHMFLRSITRCILKPILYASKKIVSKN